MNKTINRKKILNTAGYGILFTLLMTIYFKIIQSDPVLNYDDKILIEPLAHMTKLSEYWQSLFNGYIYDIQPVRDLSFFIDLKIKHIFPFYSFHFTNLLVWALICFIFKKILNFYSRNDQEEKLSWALTFMFAFSPVALSSVAWIAARKHLLSTLFILMNTYIIISTNKLSVKKYFTIIFLYLLSCFSQPINVLWPIWATFFAYQSKIYLERKKLWITLFASLIGIAFIVLYINNTYYSGAFVAMTGGGKYDTENMYNLGLSLLALGRYLFLCLFPFDALPSTHYQGAWQNVVGLLLLPLLAFGIYKTKDQKIRLVKFSFLLFFLTPLIIVTAKMTTIFCSDTYLLTASIGIYLIIFIGLKKRANWASLVIFTYSALLFYCSHIYVRAFQSDIKLWDYSYHKEATPYSALNLAIYYTGVKKYNEADALIRQISNWETGRSLELIIAALSNIYRNSNISTEEKISRLQKFTPQTSLGAFYLSILYSNKNDSKKVLEHLPKVLMSPPEFFLSFSNSEFEEVFAVYLILCDKNKVANCTESIGRVRDFVKMPFWNEEKFQENLKKVRKEINNIDLK